MRKLATAFTVVILGFATACGGGEEGMDEMEGGMDAEMESPEMMDEGDPMMDDTMMADTMMMDTMMSDTMMTDTGGMDGGI